MDKDSEKCWVQFKRRGVRCKWQPITIPPLLLVWASLATSLLSWFRQYEVLYFPGGSMMRALQGSLKRSLPLFPKALGPFGQLLWRHHHQTMWPGQSCRQWRLWGPRHWQQMRRKMLCCSQTRQSLEPSWQLLLLWKLHQRWGLYGDMGHHISWTGSETYATLENLQYEAGAALYEMMMEAWETQSQVMQCAEGHRPAGVPNPKAGAADDAALAGEDKEAEALPGCELKLKAVAEPELAELPAAPPRLNPGIKDLMWASLPQVILSYHGRQLSKNCNCLWDFLK